jgi:hypothetical protein
MTARITRGCAHASEIKSATEIGNGSGNHGKRNPANAKVWDTFTRCFQHLSHVRQTMGRPRMLATRMLRHQCPHTLILRSITLIYLRLMITPTIVHTLTPTLISFSISISTIITLLTLPT